MSNILQVLGTGLVMSLGVLCAQQNAPQEKPAETPPPATAATKKENPVKATPEVLAAAKKIFGYDCAMCHGAIVAEYFLRRRENFGRRLDRIFFFRSCRCRWRSLRRLLLRSILLRA